MTTPERSDRDRLAALLPKDFVYERAREKHLTARMEDVNDLVRDVLEVLAAQGVQLGAEQEPAREPSRAVLEHALAVIRVARDSQINFAWHRAAAISQAEIEAALRAASLPERDAPSDEASFELAPEEIEAAARALWRMGNARIGERPWESVSAHYIAEAIAALEAAVAAARGEGSE